MLVDDAGLMHGLACMIPVVSRPIVHDLVGDFAQCCER